MSTSRARKIQATLSEKSSWTPKNYVPTNEKIFEERFTLIKKWYSAWSEEQRWSLLEHMLRQLSDNQLLYIHSLLQPAIPTPPPPPPPDQDFTRVLPRFLCLKIFAMLDPRTLCRASQVCWYWKFLAECNEIWRGKCLRLNWFLPTPPPPQMNDCSLWKRHYVACVCQLHWNPPQRPTVDIETEADDDLVTSAEEEHDEKRLKKKCSTRRHLSSNEAKKPWRNPDPHPSDIRYSYKVDTEYLPLYSRFPSMRSARAEYTPNLMDSHECTLPLPSGRLTSTPPALPPPLALLHPTLLEKMRLDSPTPAHMHLTTLNRQQTEEEISDTLYGLQETAPFPKLPLYFVHQDESGGDASITERKLSIEEAESPELKEQSSAVAGKRPHSGRSSLSINSSSNIRSDKDSSKTAPEASQKSIYNNSKA